MVHGSSDGETRFIHGVSVQPVLTPSGMKIPLLGQTHGHTVGALVEGGQLSPALGQSCDLQPGDLVSDPDPSSTGPRHFHHLLLTYECICLAGEQGFWSRTYCFRGFFLRA